jgi:hypothetical protein
MSKTKPTTNATVEPSLPLEIGCPLTADPDAPLDLYAIDEDVEDGLARENELGPIGQLMVTLAAVAVLGVIIVGIVAVLSRMLD